MATIYSYDDGRVITDGLQSGSVSDEAARTAMAAAKDSGRPVYLEDDHSVSIVQPNGVMRQPTASEMRAMGWDEDEGDGEVEEE